MKVFKKVLFLLIFTFIFSNVVLADDYDDYNRLFFDELGNDYTNEYIFTNNDIVNAFSGSNITSMAFSYYDKDGNLLESYAVDNSSRNYADPYKYKIGLSCDTLFKTYFPDDAIPCELDKDLIYSSGKDYSDIIYWQVTDTGNSYYDDKPITPFNNFCINNSLTHNSRMCKEVLDNPDFKIDWAWDYVAFKEYIPASFQFSCESERIKKGEVANCELKMNSTDDIKEITVPVEQELYEIVELKQIEGLNLTDNGDGTITIKNEQGFNGEVTILSLDLKFKENLIDDVKVDLNNIVYTTTGGYEFKDSVSDTVSIYDDKKEEVKNPNTMSYNVLLISFLICGIIGFIAVFIKPKKRYE